MVSYTQIKILCHLPVACNTVTTRTPPTNNTLRNMFCSDLSRYRNPTLRWEILTLTKEQKTTTLMCSYSVDKLLYAGRLLSHAFGKQGSLFASRSVYTSANPLLHTRHDHVMSATTALIIVIITYVTIFIVLSSTAWSHMRAFTLGLLSISQSAPGGLNT